MIYNPEHVIKEFMPDELAYMIEWINERESVRQKKEAQLPKPWTNNPYLRDYRWCNVKRMDDKVSKALLMDWYGGTNKQKLIAAAVLARMINWPETLKFAYGLNPVANGNFNLEAGREKLHIRNASGEKLITGAYMVPGIQGQVKADSITNLALEAFAKANLILKPTMKETWQELMKLPTIGSFLAGQIVADLCYTTVGELWDDTEFFAPLGPGSSRGMNRLWGRPKNTKMTQEQFEKELSFLINVLRPKIQNIWDDRKLQAMDIQNCLCEFDKYRRLMLKEGSVRAKYQGQA